MTTTESQMANESQSRYRNLLVGEHEMAILGLLASGMTIDAILETGTWSTNDVATILRRHGLEVGEDGTAITGALAVDQGVKDALASPSPMVRKEARRAYAQLMKLRKALGMQAARDVSDDLRRLQMRAVQDWLTWLVDATTDARNERARLRASSPRSARAKQATPESRSA